MNAVIIPRSVIVRELRLAAGCLVVAFGLNVYAIVRFDTHWSELLTTLHVTLALTALFYALVTLPRLLLAALRPLWRREHF
jgi:hypothetical protein